MKTKIEHCNFCNEETLHDIGKKQGRLKIRRTTNRCRNCGTREINNRINGRRVIKGHNLKKEMKNGI